jgi:N utilization substance protein A
MSGEQGTKTATVVVPEDQLSLAIGRDGQNARLAAKLTGWRIDIKSLPEAASESLNKLVNQPEKVENPDELAQVVPQIEATLAKKEEGRPITPEEYQAMGKFVDQIERGASIRYQAELEAEQKLLKEVRSSIPDAAFDIPLDDLGLAPSLVIKITGEGFSTIGDLMLQLEVDPDAVLGINGVGPKAMENIQEALEAFEFPQVEEEPVEAGQEPEAAETVQPADEAQLDKAAKVEEAEPEVGEVAEKPEVDKEAAPEKAPEETEHLSVEEVFAQTSKKLLKQTAKSTQAVEPKTDLADDETKKKDKKKKYREIEYDPDLDVTIVKRRHKRNEEGWEEDWDA